MDYASSSRLCRACMGCVESNEINNDYIEMYRFCTSITVVKSDPNVSLCFCNNCASQLVMSYHFINQCLKSDLEWQSVNISKVCKVKNEEDSYKPDYNYDDSTENFDESITVASVKDVDVFKDNTTENTLSEKWQNTKKRMRKKVFKKIKVRKKIKLKNPNKFKNKSYHCPVCEKSLLQAQLLQTHLKNDHPEYKKYLCHICNKGFRYKRSLMEHLEKHSDLNNFECDICHKIYKFKGAVRKHIESHLFGRHRCDKCDKSFEHSQYLKSHMRLHKGHKPHLCDTCGQGFALATNLKVHMRIHSGERPYKCSLCSYTSPFSGAFRRHKMTHTRSDRRPCTICGKDFSDLGGLKRHSRLHTGELPFKCDYCEMGFVDGWKRRIHIAKHHNIPLSDIPHLMRYKNATKVILDSDEDNK